MNFFFNRDSDAPSSDLPPSLNALKKPGSRVGPLALNRLHRDAVKCRNLLQLQTDEEPELHHLRLGCIQTGQLVKSIVHFKQTIVRRFSGGVEAGHVNALLAAAMPQCPFPPGILDEDAPHRLRCRGEKVTSAIPPLVSLARQPQPGLVHQGSGLQGLARRLLGHFGGSQPAQFLVDQRQQPLRVQLPDGSGNSASA